jgi:hypothetical protein
MADPRRPAVEDDEPRERRPTELEREERRLERLRLIAAPWPTPHPEFEPDPQEAA